jgi:cell division protein FtsI (penicillin-binding protein 3)
MLPYHRSYRFRLIAIAFGFALLFGLLVLRFYQIQIVEHDQWNRIALKQHACIIEEPARRGSILSNTSLAPGHPLDKQPFVFDVQVFHLFVDPAAIEPHLQQALIASLSQILQRPSREAEWQLCLSKKSRNRRLEGWLEAQDKDRIEAWWIPFAKQHRLPLNALYCRSAYRRSYPYGPLLGAVLHTVQRDKDPTEKCSIPTGGLELLYNEVLEGRSGFRKRLRSPSRMMDVDLGHFEVPLEPGADIELTMNHHIQAIVEKELSLGIKKAHALGGWAVLMEPHSGEIWALAQDPPFDPRRYFEYFNRPDWLDRTRMKAALDCFEPGSMFKPLILAVCLRGNEELMKAKGYPLFTPDEKVATSQGMFPGRLKPLKDGRCHSFLNMDLAIQKSSNIYPAKIVERLIRELGEEWLRTTLVATFGFGVKTGIELPAEEPGLVPRLQHNHPNGRPEWSLSTPYSIAMGYNILVNSIQMASAYSTLANGGFRIRPHIVRKIVKHKEGREEILLDQTTWTHQERVLSEAIVRRLNRSLRFVTQPGGTSSLADVPGYTEIGKSGSAEKVVAGIYSKDHHVSSFVGFVPAENPKFVLIVTLDDPEKKWIPGVGKNQLGGVSVAPIFRDIAEQVLHYLGVEPNDPYGYPVGDPRRNRKKALWAEEVGELLELYKDWNHAA